MEITRIGAILFLVLTPTYNFRIALVIPAIRSNYQVPDFFVIT